MSINRKSLSDVRLTPERTIPAEPIKVEYINGEYVALLAEAPLSVQTTTVVLDGTQRIYTTSQTPTVGTYSIKKHSNKFIPILLFHESDNNLTGTCDYYKTGTILCAAHWEADHEFLKPLVTDYSTVEELAGNIPPTTDFNTRGYPGDRALLLDKSVVYSTGTSWQLNNAAIHSHNLADLTEDTDHRLVSDTEKSTWNGKQNALGYTAESTSNKGTASGYAPLDENSKVPAINLPNNLKEIKVVANITARNILDTFEGLRCHVLDATADETVTSGWAEYLYTGSSWVKTAENESIDIVLDWSNVTNKPTLGTASSLNVATIGNASNTEVVKGDDTRLTDSRTPVAHNQAASTVSVDTTNFNLNLTASEDTVQKALEKLDDLVAGGGGGGLTPETRTVSDNNAVLSNNTSVLADTSGGAFTLLLPSAPEIGDHIQFIDAKNSFPTNNLTVGRNTKLINGLSEDLLIDVSEIIDLYYQNDTYGWKVDIGNSLVEHELILTNRYLSNLVEEKIITSNCSSVTFTGLNSLEDGDYILEIDGRGSTAATTALSAYINDDETETNYTHVNISVTSSNTIPSGSTENNAKVGAIRQNGYSFNRIVFSCGNSKVVMRGEETSNDNTSIISNIKCVKKNTPTTEITKIKIYASSGATIIGTGSIFRLYKSNSAQKLISYDPIDITARTSDYFMRPGEVVYRTYTNATSVPLNIATTEGIYELKLINASVGVTDFSSVSNIYLMPNNTLVTAGQINYNRIKQENTTVNGISDVATQQAFIVSNDKTGIVSEVTIYTYLNQKVVTGTMLCKTATDDFANFIFHQPWVDTTTHWTSLGTLTFVAAQSGKVIVKRII